MKANNKEIFKNKKFIILIEIKIFYSISKLF